MISVKTLGNFNNLEAFINRALKRDYLSVLNQYGRRGVEALKANTPVDSGKTRDSWSYEITRTKDKTTISWNNSNFENDIPIAIILQYGHATKNGGFVQGIDYINPAMKPIFEQMANEAWGRLTR